jgi:hypothetical protein
MTNFVYGDKVGRDKNTQIGDRNRISSNGASDISPEEFRTAIAELQNFVARLRDEGVITPAGDVSNPVAVVQAVQSRPSRLRAVSNAIAGGAKDAILSTMKNGVSELIVELIKGQNTF